MENEVLVISLYDGYDINNKLVFENVIRTHMIMKYKYELILKSQFDYDINYFYKALKDFYNISDDEFNEIIDNVVDSIEIIIY